MAAAVYRRGHTDERRSLHLGERAGCPPSLLAALNCDWPELLPERLRGQPKERLRAAVDELRRSAG